MLTHGGFPSETLSLKNRNFSIEPDLIWQQRKPSLLSHFKQITWFQATKGGKNFFVPFEVLRRLAVVGLALLPSSGCSHTLKFSLDLARLRQHIGKSRFMRSSWILFCHTNPVHGTNHPGLVYATKALITP